MRPLGGLIESVPEHAATRHIAASTTQIFACLITLGPRPPVRKDGPVHTKQVAISGSEGGLGESPAQSGLTTFETYRPGAESTSSAQDPWVSC